MKKIRSRRQVSSGGASGGRQSSSKPEAKAPSYRRNRTLTGSSPEVGTERTRAHRLRAMRRKVGLIMGITVALAAIIVFGLSQFSRSVDIIFSNSDSFVQAANKQDYIKIIDEYYRSHPFERFRFLTNHDKMLGVLIDQAPEVSAIAPAGRLSFGAARYELSLRQPVASWTVDESKYYVDSHGGTFTSNFFAEPKVSVADNSGAEVTEGSAIASGRLLSFVGRVVSLSSDAGVDIGAIELPPDSMRTVYARVEGDPVVVRMSIDRGVEAQVQDMRSAFDYFSERSMPEYIDVRVQGSAFYR